MTINERRQICLIFVYHTFIPLQDRYQEIHYLHKLVEVSFTFHFAIKNLKTSDVSTGTHSPLASFLYCMIYFLQTSLSTKNIYTVTVKYHLNYPGSLSKHSEKVGEGLLSGIHI